MPDGVVELAYPTFGAPERVDWVDYAERNAAADPQAIADEVLAEAGRPRRSSWCGTPSYSTLGTQCEDLTAALGAGEALVQGDESRFFEPAYLYWRPAA